MALIVNADDFGLSPQVNRAIVQAFDEGLIGRTTLMVNMPAAKEAVELARERGFLDKVGLHLNLTSGRPLTDSISKDPVMCSGSGEFTADFARNIKTRLYLPKTTQLSVEKEIRAQLDMYRDLGCTLWHIDSHHHVHTDPSVWIILKKVMKDYPVTSVRLGRNMYRGGNPLMHLYKFILNSSVKKYCSTCPDYFGSAVDYEAFFGSKSADSNHYDIEVMVHPVFDGEGKLCDATGNAMSEMIMI